MKIFSAQLKGTTIVVSGSTATITGSFTGSIAGIDINATNTFTASTIARLNSIETISSSNDSRVNSLKHLVVQFLLLILLHLQLQQDWIV